jgi:sterol 3beta-glucosyltransferase
VPQVGDQRYWADRLHRLGVAPAPVTLHRISAEQLATPILATAGDPAMHRAAGDLGGRIRGEDGLVTGIGLIERAIERG